VIKKRPFADSVPDDELGGERTIRGSRCESFFLRQPLVSSANFAETLGERRGAEVLLEVLRSEGVIVHHRRKKNAHAL
jgi:hypothetical protein